MAPDSLICGICSPGFPGFHGNIWRLDLVWVVNALVDKEINGQFDIALLGYGAYDMPLGVAIKRDGRQGDSSQWIASTVFWDSQPSMG